MIAARDALADHCFSFGRGHQSHLRAAVSEARKIVRQACHILTELGDDALTAA